MCSQWNVSGHKGSVFGSGYNAQFTADIGNVYCDLGLAKAPKISGTRANILNRISGEVVLVDEVAHQTILQARGSFHQNVLADLHCTAI